MNSSAIPKTALNIEKITMTLFFIILSLFNIYINYFFIESVI